MNTPTISPTSPTAMPPGASSENSATNSQIMSPDNQAASALSREPDTPTTPSDRPPKSPWYFAGNSQDHTPDTSTAGGSLDSSPDASTSPFLDDPLSNTMDSIYEDAAIAYIYKKRKEFGGPTDPDTLRRELIYETRQAFFYFNDRLPKGSRLQVPSSLRPVQIALLILAFWHIYNIECGDEGSRPSWASTLQTARTPERIRQKKPLSVI